MPSGPRAACNTRLRSADPICGQAGRRLCRLPAASAWEGSSDGVSGNDPAQRARHGPRSSTIPGSAGSSTRSSSSSRSSPSSGGSSATRSKTCSAPTSPPASASCSGRAGFDIGQSADRLFRRTRPISRALLVGLLNTLLVAVTGIVTASIIGFLVGIGRLSQQLADPQDLDRLCRGLPQHPAAAGHLLLVSRRAVGAAAAARQLPAAVRLLS